MLSRAKIQRMILAITALVALAGISATAQFDNRQVHDRIKQDLKKHKLANISVTVDAGEVVLTGTVVAQPQRKQAGQIARSDAPGMLVLNYIALQKPKKPQN